MFHTECTERLPSDSQQLYEKIKVKDSCHEFAQLLCMHTVSLAAHVQSTVITTTVWLGLQLFPIFITILGQTSTAGVPVLRNLDLLAS